MRNARQERVRRAEERKVIAWISEQPPGDTVKDLCRSTTLSERTVRTILRDLRARGKIERAKARKRASTMRMLKGGADYGSPEMGVRHAVVVEYRYWLRTKSTKEA